MQYVFVERRRGSSILSVLFHIFMIGITGGLWLFYLIIRGMLR